MTQKTRVAALQMNSTDSVDANLDFVRSEIEKVADSGAELIVLPENWPFMGAREKDRLALIEQPGAGPLQDVLADLSERHNLCLVGGSIPLAVDGDDEHFFSSCLVYDRGGVVARYDKIHLFDVEVPESGARYRESATIRAGQDVVVADTSVGRVGLSICYDLRFPELYRALSTAGAQFIVVPSAFTRETGQAHWAVLLRARAIENLACVIGANQVGTHPGGRETFGHSMIVDPWGEVLAEATSGAGHVVAEVDLQRLEYTRRSFPTLDHRKLNA